MKKLIAALMTVMFLGSVTGLALAQGTAPSTTPVAKTAKHVKKHAKKAKKAKKETAPVASSTPAAK